jgi:PTH1 family peptidyl-tRNA hydrolase
MVIDHLLNELVFTNVSKSSFEGELFKTSQALLLKPTTYMNNSGVSTQRVQHFYKIETEQMIVIHDDLDLPFGTLRFKRGGGHGGHNGLKSIDAHGGKEYIRVRMGIGRPAHKGEVSSFVLSPFSSEEQSELQGWIKHTSEAVLKLFELSLENVASRYSIKR